MSAPGRADRTVRVALIGYGRAGQTFHTPLIRSTPGLELTVIASARPDAVHADLPRIVVVQSPADAWTRAEVDVVVIATPNSTHEALAAEALEAGKHVVVDKPLTDSLEGARRLAALASRKGRLLTAFHNRRWDGDFLALQEIVRSGTLGDITHFESHFDRYRRCVRDRWRERPGAGSGIWFDLGPHLVDQAMKLFGLPAWVSGHVAAHRTGALADDWAHVVLGYDHRAVILHASMLVAASVPRFVVHGSRASWVKYGSDPQEFRLAAEMGVDLGAAPAAESAAVIDGTTHAETATPIPRGDYRHFYAALRDAVAGEGSIPVPPAEAIATVAVVQTATQSSAERRALPLRLADEERRALASIQVQ